MSNDTFKKIGWLSYCLFVKLSFDEFDRSLFKTLNYYLISKLISFNRVFLNLFINRTNFHIQNKSWQLRRFLTSYFVQGNNKLFSYTRQFFVTLYARTFVLASLELNNHDKKIFEKIVRKLKTHYQVQKICSKLNSSWRNI